MAQGFTTYIDEVIDPNIIDIEAILDGMSGAMKLSLLNSYAIDSNPYNVDRTMVPIHRDAIVAIFNEITNVRDYSIVFTRGEVVIGYITDPDTGEQTPDYNTIPVNKTELINGVLANPDLTDLFSTGEITAIINKMLLWSKRDIDGDYVGTFTTFAQNI